MRPSTLLTVALCASQFAASFAVRIIALASSGVSDATFDAFGWLAMTMLIGAFLGTLVVWPLSWVLSRKQVMFVTIAVGLLGGIIVTASDSAVPLLVGAGFAGVSNTMTYITASLWQAENAEPHHRGKRIILQYLGGLIGYALATWISFAFRVTSVTYQALKGVVSIQLIFLLVALGLVYFAPDSYRWLLSHNKPEEARAALARMRNQQQSNPAVTAYFNTLVQHRSQFAASRFCSCSSSRKRGSNPNGVHQLHSKRRLILGIAVQAMSALSGIQAASLYIASAVNGIFLSSGPLPPSLLGSFLPTLDCLFLLIPFFLLPRLGIRKLLTIGSLGLALCLLISLIVSVAGNSYIYSASSSGIENRHSKMSGVFFTFLLGAFIFYDLSWTSLSWVFLSEIGSSVGYNDENTAIACIATAIRAAIEIGVAFAVVFGVAGIGALLLIVWLLLCISFAVLVWLFFPETVGRALEDLDLYFARAPRKVVFRDVDATRVKKAGGGGSTGFTMPLYGSAEMGAQRSSADDRWAHAQTYQRQSQPHELHASIGPAPPPAYNAELQGDQGRRS